MLQKHIGITNLGTRVAVVNWKLPNTEFALVVETESLPPRYQDSFIQLLNDSQMTNEKLDSLLHRNVFPSGENMLQALHSNGHLHKVLIENIQLFVDTAGKKMQLRDVVNASEGKPVGEAVPTPEVTAEDIAMSMDPATKVTETELPAETVNADAPDVMSVLQQMQEQMASMQAQMTEMNKPKKRGRPPKAKDAK